MLRQAFRPRSLPCRPLAAAPATWQPAMGSRRGKAAAASGLQSDYDIGIVGGGVIGSSIALHLASAAPEVASRIVVFERDPTYQWASAPRSAGGIRQQFSLPINVQLSIHSAEFLKSGLQELCKGVDVDTDVQFRENGYLMMASPGAGEATLRKNVEMQRSLGADWIDILDVATVKERFPWLSTDGLAAAAFGHRNEGLFDPWALLQAMRKAAMARGVKYVEAEVSGLHRNEKGEVSKVVLSGKEEREVSVATVINAAGAFGGQLVAECGPDVTPLPVKPRKRCIFMVHARDGDDVVLPPTTGPLTIDPSGVYFRPEGSPGRYLCAVSPKPEDDPDTGREDLEHVDHELYEEIVWPQLAERVPAFEALRLESSWAGLYEYNTLDQNGVVGWHPEVPNMLVACGFSGHGLMHSPGVGRACSELILDGSFRTLDLSCLGFDRIVRGEPMKEKSII